MRNQNLMTLIPLFFVIFLDVMGICLGLPVLTTLFMDPNSAMIPADTSLIVREMLYGVTMALFPLAMFFGAPLWGDLSDIHGRKKILLICLFVASGSYLFSALAIKMNSLVLLFISRLITGFMCGSQPLAQAAIADISTDETKPLNMSIITFAGSLGVAVGPIFGGYFTDSTIVSWFDNSTPFLLGGIFSFVNGVSLYFMFRETYFPKVHRTLNIVKGFHMFIAAFKREDIRILSIVFLLINFAWGLYIQAVSLILAHSFQYDNSSLGLFTGFLGVNIVLANTIGVRLAIKYLKLIHVVIISTSVMSVGLFIAFYMTQLLGYWLTLIPISMGCGLGYTMMLTLFSNVVDKDSQGWIMGVTGAIMAMDWTLTALIIGALSYYSSDASILAAGLAVLIAAIMMCYFKPKAELKNV